MIRRRGKHRRGAESINNIMVLAVGALIMVGLISMGKTALSPETTMAVLVVGALLVFAGFGIYQGYNVFNDVTDMYLRSFLSDGSERTEREIMQGVRRMKWLYYLVPWTVRERLSFFVRTGDIVLDNQRYRLKGANGIKRKKMPRQTSAAQFDVFISHNSKNKPAVREITQKLIDRGVKAWLDELELVPGRPWQDALEEIIETTKSAAILVGEDGLGPWEIPEMRACLTEFVKRQMPVIPVLLPGAPDRPELPLFLRQFTWVDLRSGLSDDGLDRLQWGITGEREQTE